MSAENRPDALSERCLPRYSFLANRLDQTPCTVARRLIDVCDGEQQAYYDLDPLDLERGQRTYREPNPFQTTSCLCSMGVYNLVQGCAACQDSEPYTATLWTNWVANCTMSMINGGAIFPYSVPADTSLPDWACVNNAGGSLSVGQAFRHITGQNYTTSKSSSSSASASSATSTSASRTQASYTAAEASQTLEKTKVDSDDDDVSGKTTKIVAVVVPLVVVAALLGVVFAYLRKKRNFRRRGHKLGSNADLPVSGAGGLAPVRSRGSTVNFAEGAVMRQKNSRSASLFAPSESVFGRNSVSRPRSFATNSVSTGAGNPFANRQSTLYTPSSGFDTSTFDDGASSFTGTGGERYRDDVSSSAHGQLDEDDDESSISPFSDLHRPPPSRVTTRNNIHTSPYPHSSPSSFRQSASTFGSIHLSESSAASTRGGADARSLLTVSSDGAPPSSCGATYGGLHDDEEDDDDDGEGYEGSLRSRR
ncbi:hypothetical protein JCM10213_004137 [Rhodosporidiobolus nylandii]